MPEQKENIHLFTVIKSQKCYGNNKMYFSLIIMDYLSRLFHYKIFNGKAIISNGDEIQIDSPAFERNKNPISKSEIKLSIKSGSNYVILRKNQTEELRLKVESFNSKDPLTIPATFPATKLHYGLYLLNNMEIKDTVQNNKFVIGNVTDNIKTKLRCVLLNQSSNVRLPNPDEMVFIDGVGAVIRTKWGLQFKFIIGEIIIIQRNETNLDIVWELKRQLYLNPIPIQITGKERLGASNLKRFIELSNGLKHSVHSKVLRIWLDTLDFKKNICTDNNGDLFFIGTAYVKDERDGQGHRVKIKHAPMENIIFKMSVDEAINYEKDALMQLDILERVEGKFYDCEFMYGYSAKISDQEPSKKRRKLNNGNVYCNTGYVSITNMTLV